MFCFLKENIKSLAIKKALKSLNKKNFALIVHGNSFPSCEDNNTGFGSPNSSNAKNLINFASKFGFNSIQLGPAGKTKSCDASPYNATVFSLNPLFIDLEELTTEKWNYILSKETFNDIVNNNPNRKINKTAYSYIYLAQNQALKEAFNNFKKHQNPDFSKFKEENKFWLEKDSLYEDRKSTRL